MTTENETTEKSRSSFALPITLLLILIFICAICFTMAKYISSVSGSDDAKVASWHIEVNDVNITTGTPSSLAFDLFETINDQDTVSPEQYVSDGYIAPGTGGSFDLVIENLSQVDAEYSLTLSATDPHAVPLEYSLDKDIWYDDLAEISKKDVFLKRETGTDKLTVYWRWGYNKNTDEADTALGILAQKGAVSYDILAKLTAVQAN